MFVVGLTGGIGAGKSTVASLFAAHKVPIIDADIIARTLTEPNTPAFKEIVTHFGDSILTSSHTLDRAALRQLIFSTPKEKKWLEDLLHPIIRLAIQTQISAIKAPYCIAVIPLLLETEFYSFINRILVIDATPQTQIDRTMVRDAKQAADILAVIQTQANREMRNARAHDIIVNDGSLEDLVPQVEKLHHLYLSMAKQNDAIL